MMIKSTEIFPFGMMIQPVVANYEIVNLSIKTLKNYIDRHQLLVLRGFRPFNHTNAFVAYCEQWGQISIWPFGKVLELIEQEKPTDHIFHNSYVPLHWDGMYRPFIPEFQIFHCVSAPKVNQGGRTTFSNTVKVLQNVRQVDLAIWEKTTGLYSRKMEFYNSRTVSPIVIRHPYKDYQVIRFNEPNDSERGEFLNPATIKFRCALDVKINSVIERLKSYLYSKENYYAHEWQQGDIVIADNFSLLHGREEFESKSLRHLQRVHIESQIPYKNPGLELYE